MHFWFQSSVCPSLALPLPHLLSETMRNGPIFNQPEERLLRHSWVMLGSVWHPAVASASSQKMCWDYCIAAELLGTTMQEDVGVELSHKA